MRRVALAIAVIALGGAYASAWAAYPGGWSSEPVPAPVAAPARPDDQISRAPRADLVEEIAIRLDKAGCRVDVDDTDDDHVYIVRSCQ